MSAPGKVARNEQRKLRAATYNAVALAFGVVGVIQPLVMGAFAFEVAAKVAICAAIGYILHNHAVRLLAELED